MDANVLKRIFFDKHGHWDAFVQKYGERVRSAVVKEVEKFVSVEIPSTVLNF